MRIIIRMMRIISSRGLLFILTLASFNLSSHSSSEIGICGGGNLTFLVSFSIATLVSFLELVIYKPNIVYNLLRYCTISDKLIHLQVHHSMPLCMGMAFTSPLSSLLSLDRQRHFFSWFRFLFR